MPDTVLITGASSDIGMALMAAMSSVANPPRILAHFHRGSDRLDRFIAGHSGIALEPLQADLTVPAEVDSLADRVLSLAAPSAWIHLPGVRFRYERFAKADRSSLRAELSVQVESAFALAQRLLPEMTKLPSGRVVFLLSSVTRDLPPRHLASYVTAKYAQLGLMRALAADLAGSAVTVNAVAPAMVDTRFLDALPQSTKELVAKQHPLGRLASADDVADAIMFMLSPAASYVHGTVLPVTGGATS